jgi:hypothetical protein
MPFNPQTFKIRVATRKYANFGDGIRVFEPGQDYTLPLCFRDHPWVAQHAEVVPDGPEDPVFDMRSNRWSTRGELEAREAAERAHNARLADEKRQREARQAEEKERLERQKLKNAVKITARGFAHALRAGTKKEQAGRPRNTGYTEQDKRLIEEAKKLLWKSKVKSLAEGIKKVAGKAPGKGSEASKIKRLLSRLSE